jgi:hypothetical protein
MTNLFQKTKKAVAKTFNRRDKSRELRYEMQQDVRDIRAHVGRLELQRREVESAPPSRAELEQRAAQVVQSLAESARLRSNFGALAAPSEYFSGNGMAREFVPAPELAQVQEGHVILPVRGLSPMECLAISDPEKLAETFVAEAIHATNWQESTALSGADRQARINDIENEIWENLVLEESMVRDTEVGGHGIPRRPDGDPRVWLLPDAELEG